MQSDSPGIDEFLASKRNQEHIDSRTHKSYKTELEEFQRFLDTRPEHRVIWAAKKDDINLFLSKRGANNSLRWKYRRLAPINEYFKYLQQIGNRADNPTVGIRLGKGPPRSDPQLVLSREEVVALKNAPKGRLVARDRALIHVFCAGLKKADVLSLNRRDFDQEKRHIRIGDRRVPLAQDALDALSEYLRLHPLEKADPLFPGRAKRRMSDRQAWHIVKQYVDDCGLDERTTLETLRATFAVQAMEDGLSYIALINALGTFNDDWLRSLTKIAENRLKTSAGADHKAVPLRGIRVYPAGDDDLVYRDLAGELVKAKSAVMIVDGYLDEHIFNLYLKKIPPAAKIRVLSRSLGTDLEHVAKKFGAGRQIEVRTTRHVHDRHLFIDGRGWVIGQSIKDAARDNPTYIIELSEDSVGAFKDAQEAIWSGATAVIQG